MMPLKDSTPLILLVDDDADLLEILGLGLKSAGFSVATATNGLDAVKQAKSLNPDLIVLDLVLPEMDGFTVCDTLRKERSTASVPVLMLTGLTSQCNRSSGLKCGADDYLQKPITVGELLARIKPLLPQPPPEQPARPNAPRHNARSTPPSAAR